MQTDFSLAVMQCDRGFGPKKWRKMMMTVVLVLVLSIYFDFLLYILVSFLLRALNVPSLEQLF